MAGGQWLFLPNSPRPSIPWQLLIGDGRPRPKHAHPRVRRIESRSVAISQQLRNGPHFSAGAVNIPDSARPHAARSRTTGRGIVGLGCQQGTNGIVGSTHGQLFHLPSVANPRRHPSSDSDRLGGPWMPSASTPRFAISHSAHSAQTFRLGSEDSTGFNRYSCWHTQEVQVEMQNAVKLLSDRT